MAFQAPIGTEKERAAGIIWPGGWTDATPYLTRYAIGIHTGADLNLNLPGGWDKDAHSPVYAIGDGVVTYAQRYPNHSVWGNIVVVDHGTVDGKPLFSRYAHVEKICVQVGHPIKMGEQIASVGNGFGLFAYHLHFDISNTTILKERPGNWPAPRSNPNPELVRQHYVDPKAWLMRQHVIQGVTSPTDDIKPSPNAIVWYVIIPTGMRVCKDHGTAAGQVGFLPYGTKLFLLPEGGVQDGYRWGHITGGEYDGCWLAIGKQDRSETYVSTNPPQ